MLQQSLHVPHVHSGSLYPDEQAFASLLCTSSAACACFLCTCHLKGTKAGAPCIRLGCNLMHGSSLILLAQGIRTGLINQRTCSKRRKVADVFPHNHVASQEASGLGNDSSPNFWPALGSARKAQHSSHNVIAAYRTVTPQRDACTGLVTGKHAGRRQQCCPWPGWAL